MMNVSKLALPVAIVLCATAVSAQLPTTKILTLEVAQIIATEAIAKCRADGFKVSVLVVDAGDPRNAPAGHVHNYLAREGTPPPELLAAGRAEVTGYGGEVVTACPCRLNARSSIASTAAKTTGK